MIKHYPLGNTVFPGFQLDGHHLAQTISTLKSDNQTRSPENRLLDHVERLEHVRSGHFGIIINLSKLCSHNRLPHHIRIARRSFEIVLNSSDIGLYTLTPGDLVAICKEFRLDAANQAINKVRRMFQNDPLAESKKPSKQDEFVTWYDLEIEYEKFRKFIKNLTMSAQYPAPISIDASVGCYTSDKYSGQALDPLGLANAKNSLNRIKIGDLVRKQAAVVIGINGTEQILFFENFVSIKELQQQIAAGFNLASNLWLFNYLTESIDKHLLQSLEQVDFSNLSHNLSLNLNIQTVMGRHFQNFDNIVAKNSEKLIVELQQIDILSNMSEFRKVRDQLRERGYTVLMDGLNPTSLRLFNLGDIDADYYKIQSHSEFSEIQSLEAHSEIAKQIEYMGPSRFIITQADTEATVRWGLQLGIRQFQGYFIDDLVDRQLKIGERPTADKWSSQEEYWDRRG